jgi:chromosome condensin MukBEF complex kleisin-like MukF subunit
VIIISNVSRTANSGTSDFHWNRYRYNLNKYALTEKIASSGVKGKVKD